jgi:hypothetical protein
MAKTLVYEGWKSLDFLGFSRPNRAFSIGYERFSLEKILAPLAAAAAAARKRARAVLECGNAGLVIGQA